MARVVLDGPITGATRLRVLRALREVGEREFPALLLRIDSPGGTVGDSQEIHAALMRLRDKGAGWWPASATSLPPACLTWAWPLKQSCESGTITGPSG